MDVYSFALTALFGLIGFSIAAAWVSARTARSKGYKFGWFFVFSLVSWFITAVVVVFIKPKNDKPAKAKLSTVLMLTLGAIIEFVGLSMLPQASATLSDAEVLELFASQQSIGAIAVALAGALIVVGGVANDHRQESNNRTI
jgi:cytochrome bd-type quinol oxidase subunit 2